MPVHMQFILKVRKYCLKMKGKNIGIPKLFNCFFISHECSEKIGKFHLRLESFAQSLHCMYFDTIRTHVAFFNEEDAFYKELEHRHA